MSTTLFMQLLWASTALQIGVTGFVWNIADRLRLHDHYEVRSEKYMFSEHDGPLLMGQGSSTIQLSLVVDLYSGTNSSYSVGMGIFGVQPGHEDERLADICEHLSDYALHRTNSWAVDVVTMRFPSVYVDKQSIHSSFLGLNGSYFHRTATAFYQYTVRTPARYSVNLMICPEESVMVPSAYDYQPTTTSAAKESAMPNTTSHRRPSSSRRPSRSSSTSSHRRSLLLLSPETATSSIPLDAVASLRGSVAFLNPYGYLPAEMFGLLPFEASRMIAYALFALYFLWHFINNYSSVLMVHKAFLVVLLVAVSEAAMWFATYQMLNLSGTPYCCPFPALVVVSMVLQALRQTLCNAFLLVVSLGYGIVRPRLMRLEQVSVLVVSTLYLLSATLSQVSAILEGEHRQGGGPSPVTVSTASRYRSPQLFLDLVFIAWIYLALTSTMRILTEFQQSEKLQLYRSLALIVALAVILFGAVTFVFVLNKVWDPFLPLAYEWVEPALYEALNAAVFLAMCVLVQPTRTSHLLSYSSQLPMEDPDEDCIDIDEQTHGTIYSGEHRQQHRQSLYDHSDFDYDSNDDYDTVGIKTSKYNSSSEVEMVGAWRRGSVPHVDIGGRGYDTLPAAESSIIADAENNEFDALFKD